MSVPVTPPLPPAVPQPAFVEPSAAIESVADAPAVTRALDFLLITSRVDFSRSHKKFVDECAQAGVNAETLFVEDLPGQTPGEKLANLHRMSANWNANGKVVASTIKVELLHGRIDDESADHSLDQFRREHLGAQEAQRQSGQASLAASSAPAKMHMMTAAGGKLVFPTDLFDAALRATIVDDGQVHAGFAGTIVYSACGSGVFRDTAKQSSGSYVIASGKKSVFTEDFNAGLRALVRDQGERRRRGLPPLSARDCWNLLRDQSGEHVALVGNDTIEINKVLQSGHSEPAINVRSDAVSQKNPQDISAQAIRTLFAKIDHGSARSVQQVIDRWGPGVLSADHNAVIPNMPLWSIALESSRDSEQKMCLLIRHMPDHFLHKDLLGELLTIATKHSWISVVSETFKRMTDMTPPPMSFEQLVIWMRSNQKQKDELIKFCRRNKDVNHHVGAYLHKAQRATPDQNYLALSNFSLPPFFDELARKAAERASA